MKFPAPYGPVFRKKSNCHKLTNFEKKEEKYCSGDVVDIQLPHKIWAVIETPELTQNGQMTEDDDDSSYDRHRLLLHRLLLHRLLLH